MTAALLNTIEQQIETRQKHLASIQEQIYAMECSDDYCYINGKIDALWQERASIEKELTQLKACL